MNYSVLEYFRKSMKEIRTMKKIGSRELSRKIGKAETYISQFERGLIKSPDYQICFEIMKELGFAEKDIPNILFEQYEIMSPEEEKAYKEAEEREIERMQELYNDPDYLQAELIRYLESEKEAEEREKRSELIKSSPSKMWGENYSEDRNEKFFAEVSGVDDEIAFNIKSALKILSIIQKHDKNYAHVVSQGFYEMLKDSQFNILLYNFIFNFFKHDIKLLDEEGLLKVMNSYIDELNQAKKKKTAFGTPKKIKKIVTLQSKGGE
ncbi:helix-turn-helix domain-containing protein [Bacillus altitudinis]|uniref:helix-turn-helix domain-containing protein n=1 Tax=Bacillus altitudinis TaxID=293387 RepID=UPI0022DD5BFF|nr:helix-turn-helix transcriptional regulator [Bacillus altitudinis]WBL50371.1 helix-turn-helix domain-containing protein [Bacillus altitudinis]